MPQSIIDFYKKIEHASTQMLNAAKNNAWEDLYAHETSCKILINELRELSKTNALTPAERKEKSKIMQSILNNDAQIRIIIEPWLSVVDFSQNRSSKNTCVH